MGTTIREAVAGDAANVASLLVELGYPGTSEQAARSRLETWAAEQFGTVLVAERGNEVVGVLALSSAPFLEREGRWGRVVALVTSESCRGEGVGRELMTAAEDIARRFGCVRMEVSSANRRTGAHAFYTRIGYENWADRAGRFMKDLVPGFSDGSYAARFPAGR